MGPSNEPDLGPRPASRPGRRLTLWLQVQDHAGHRSLMVELVKRARSAGVRGATVLQGISGFGASGAVHHTHLLRDDAPLAIWMVDEPARIDAFVQSVEDLLDGVLVVMDDVSIVGTVPP